MEGTQTALSGWLAGRWTDQLNSRPVTVEANLSAAADWYLAVDHNRPPLARFSRVGEVHDADPPEASEGGSAIKANGKQHLGKRVGTGQSRYNTCLPVAGANKTVYMWII